MKTRCLHPAASGFTLVEVVISASLMALILVGAYLCLSSGLASQRLLEARGEATQSARVAMALLAADLRSACPLAKDIQFVGMDRMLGEVEADNLDFATHNYRPRRAGEGDFCEVSYYVDEDRESGQLCLWRRRDPKLDEEIFAGGSREEIVRGVRGLKLEYYAGLLWYDEWGDPRSRGKKADNSLKTKPNLTGMPEAVRVTLSVEPPSRTARRTQDAPEPAMVFQTVVRLNLTGVSFGSAISGSANETAKPAASAPEGGTP